jgi:hypothetical protein
MIGAAKRPHSPNLAFNEIAHSEIACGLDLCFCIPENELRMSLGYLYRSTAE